MNLRQYITMLRNDPFFMENVACWKEIPARPARYADFPEGIDERIRRVLNERGISRLYTHQRQAVDAALRGEDIVVVTPTASGKTMCYNLPVLNRLHAGDELWITEGCSDCWAMLSAGNKAIAIPSATLLMAKDVEMISELVNRLSTPLHMFPDRDEPGERLFMQLKQLLPNLEHHQLPLGYKDFGEWWGKSLSPRPLLGEGA
jgi:5S rRNA maturation endonuclease (ribonuclease M5)